MRRLFASDKEFACCRHESARGLDRVREVRVRGPEKGRGYILEWEYGRAWDNASTGSVLSGRHAGWTQRAQDTLWLFATVALLHVHGQGSRLKAC